MMRLGEGSCTKNEPFLIPGYCTESKESFAKAAKQPESGQRKAKILEKRWKALGDEKYSGIMVPGYTGYIPKGQHYFGDRYAVFSGDAIAHMEQEQRTYAQQQKKLTELIRTQKPNRFKMPLLPITDKTKMYFPKFSIQHSLSPYTYANDDPRKYMLSGYTGFVPNSRTTIGMSYPDITNKALCEFTTATTENKEKIPFLVQRPQKSCGTHPIYIKDSGMVPHYTGHVPGEKFRYGRTFGHSTTNAVSKMKQI